MFFINSLNADLNPICHLLALLGAHHIFHVDGLISYKSCFQAPLQISKKKTLASSCLSVCLSVRPYVCPHGTTWLPLDKFLLYFIFEYFPKISQENSNFGKI
jgi:hypothetical protein